MFRIGRLLRNARKDSGADLNRLILQEDTGHGESSIAVYPDEKAYLLRAWWYFGDRKSAYEYRIEGTKVFQRLIEEWGGGKDFVKDNVVLESEIRKRPAEGERFSDVDRELARCREGVEWHETPSPLIGYFILSRHPEAFSGIELRRFFRGELERLQAGIDCVIKKTVEMGGKLREEKNGYDVELPDDLVQQSGKDPFVGLFSADSSKEFKISYGEFLEGKKLTRFLKEVLGEE